MTISMMENQRNFRADCHLSLSITLLSLLCPETTITHSLSFAYHLSNKKMFHSVGKKYKLRPAIAK